MVVRTGARNALHRARKTASVCATEISSRRDTVDCDSIARLQVKNRVRDTGHSAPRIADAMINPFDSLPRCLCRFEEGSDQLYGETIGRVKQNGGGWSVRVEQNGGNRQRVEC